MGNDYEDKYGKRLKKWRKEFTGKYHDQIERLKQGFTDEELARIAPSVEDREVYDQLIAEVQEATAKNEAIAQLEQRILSLGKKAAAFVKKIPLT